MENVSMFHIMSAIICLLVIIIVVIVIYIIRQRKVSSEPVITYTEFGESVDSTKGRSVELKRRASAAKRIEKEINTEKSNQSDYFRQYIENLENVVNPVEKKIFFYLTKNSETNPSGLFYKLVRIFKLSEYSKIYYCRRNNTTFGADDFFIITREGFAVGDSNGPDFYINFSSVDYLEEIYNEVIFSCEGDIIAHVDVNYIVYSGWDIDGFVNVTNRYLKKYKTEEIIIFNAALEAGKEMALPLLSHLCSKLGENPYGWYVRALYHYSLAKDGEDKAANLQKAVYSVMDAERELRDISNKQNRKLEESWFYGECEILMAKIELLRGDDHYAVNQRLKMIMGPEVPKEISRAAISLSTKLNLE